MLCTHPAVYAVGDTYHIMVPVDEPSLMWVEIGENRYYDESNGILRSACRVHRMVVPMAELDRCGGYTICDEVLIERLPYFSRTQPVKRYDYRFRPVPTEGAVRAYHIADAHNQVDGPVAAAKNYGEMDFLILNGDLPNHSGSAENFDDVYRIASQITGGEIPVVFARGNHDMRGNCAEEFANFTPNHNGRTYYTVRIGNLWAVILDCGEDKPDEHEAYGHTICCHAFRQRQTEYLKELIRNAQREYDAPGITHKLVICHSPFTYRQPEPFDIEEEIYTQWAQLLKEHVKPDVMICGHLHTCQVSEPGGKLDDRGQPCTVVVGADPDRGCFKACGFTFSDEGITVEFTDSDNNTHEKYLIQEKET